MPAIVRALALLLLPIAAARGQVVVNAGPDQTLTFPQRITLFAGSVTHRTPLDFWIADGDHATENDLLQYDEQTGITVVGPLQTSSGQIFGWPSDFERAGGRIYGIETFHRYLYTLDATTGICTPVGAQVSYTTLSGLAYDFASDRLFAVDQKTRKLLEFDRSTGSAKLILTLPSGHDNVRGLAYRLSDRKLYYCDDATESIYRVDPATGKNEFVLALNDGASAIVDELDFFAGRLFVSYREYDATAALWRMQLVQIDPEQGTVVYEGPVIDDCSAHSLIVNSIPERIEWVQLAGPTSARIVRPSDPESPVAFSAPGRYVFELRAIGTTTTTTDQVQIVVLPGFRSDAASGPLKLR